MKKKERMIKGNKKHSASGVLFHLLHFLFVLNLRFSASSAGNVAGGSAL